MRFWILILGLSASALLAEEALPAFSLQECITQALAKNPEIEKARESIRKTKGLIIEARAGALPQITADTGFQNEDRNRFGPSFFGPEPREDSWKVSIGVTQALYSGGKNDAAVIYAKLIQEGAFQELLRTMDSVLLSVQRTYYQARLQESLIRVSEQSLKLLEEEVELQRKRLKAGSSTRYNVLRAEVELSNARPALIRAKNQQRLALIELARLMSLPLQADTPKALPFTLKTEFPETEPLQGLETLLPLANANRPELKLLQLQLRQQEKQLQMDRSTYFPTLSAFSGYDWMGERYGEFGKSDSGYVAGVKGSWNLFDGQMTKSKVDQTRSEMELLRHEQRKVRDSVEMEVRQSHSKLEEALELLESQKKNVESAEESLRLARVRLAAGAGIQLDALSSQVALTQARTNTLQARHDYALALAELEHSAGLQIQLLIPSADSPIVPKPTPIAVEASREPVLTGRDRTPDGPSEIPADVPENRPSQEPVPGMLLNP